MIIVNKCVIVNEVRCVCAADKPCCVVVNDRLPVY